MKVHIKINGSFKNFEVAPDEYLVDTLRNNFYYSVKKGCDTSSCGVCTVLLDGAPIASCSYLTVKADGHAITTVDAIQSEAALLADLFGQVGADQCGFCNPGLALTVYAMKKELIEPTEEDIRDYLVGNLCRCTGYISQHKAILAYMEVKVS